MTPHLQPPALYEVIADRVRDLILRHELPPGAPVNEADFASAYGVSRTPVREALKILHHEGLLTAHPRRGMSVSVLTEDEQDQAADLYRLLTDYAARRHASPGADTDDSPPDWLLTRMLEIAERRLRLAHGPGRWATHPRPDRP